METNNQNVIDVPKMGDLRKGCLVNVYANPSVRQDMIGVAEILDSKPKRGLVNKHCRLEMREVRFLNESCGESFLAYIRVEREEDICG